MLNKNTNTSTSKFTYIVNRDVAQLKIQIKAYQSLNIQIKAHQLQDTPCINEVVAQRHRHYLRGFGLR